MIKVLKHSSGCKLILDSSEIFPDDPGNGTPAIVEYKNGTATLTLAQCEGYVDSFRSGDIDLPVDVIDWLNSSEIEDEVELMYEAGRDGKW